MAASDSFSLESTDSYSLLTLLKSSFALLSSNLIRSQSTETLFTSTSQFEVKSSILDIKLAFSEVLTSSVISLNAVNLPSDPARNFSVD